MTVFIHPTAIVAPSAVLEEGVSVGPYSIVGPEVTLGKEVVLKSHVVVDGRTSIGAGTEIFPFASIGLAPQDKKYKNEPSELIVGSYNVIREYTTMNPGTEGGGMITRVGDGCLFMMSTHVAHDCHVGDHVIMANNATLAGHVVVGDYVIIGGLSAVHQFVRIGAHAMIGGMSAIESDVIPYGTAIGDRASLAGLNLVGLKRRGFEREGIQAIRQAYKTLFLEGNEKPFAERIEHIERLYPNEPLVMEMVAFLKTDTTRPICRPSQSAEGQEYEQQLP